LQPSKLPAVCGYTCCLALSEIFDASATWMSF
jgi:hypothetical protein